MEKTGLLYNIFTAAASIDFGRKGFAIRGKEQEGRIAYEDGIALALSSFKEALATTDPQTIALSEYTFISQELQLCDPSDTDSLSSLTQAVQSFDDAFLALETVETPGYISADKTYPHSPKYRAKGFPKDSFHTACIAHTTRIQNILRSPGIDPIEKELLKQRRINLPAAQTAYVEKQRKTLSE